MKKNLNILFQRDGISVFFRSIYLKEMCIVMTGQMDGALLLFVAMLNFVMILKSPNSCLFRCPTACPSRVGKHCNYSFCEINCSFHGCHHIFHPLLSLAITIKIRVGVSWWSDFWGRGSSLAFTCMKSECPAHAQGGGPGGFK